MIPVFVAGATTDANGDVAFSSFDFKDIDPSGFPQVPHVRGRDIQHIVNDLRYDSYCLDTGK